MFKELARHFKEYSLYAFNFIERETRIQEYVDYILEYQPVGPYILLGWSVGGNLAFEVAVALEKRGKEVSQLILLDAYKGEGPEDGESSDGIPVDLDLQLSALHLETLRGRVLSKAKGYYHYWKGLRNSGWLRPAIHLLAAESGDTDRDPAAWKGSTGTGFHRYPAAGTYCYMLTPPNLEKNVAIIKKIIEDPLVLLVRQRREIQ